MSFEEKDIFKYANKMWNNIRSKRIKRNKMVHETLSISDRLHSACATLLNSINKMLYLSLFSSQKEIHCTE